MKTIKLSKVSLGILAALLLLAFLAGRGSVTSHSQKEGVMHDPASSAKETRWTCSMHPQINLPDSGGCPICGMDLIPLDSNDSDSGPFPVLKMSASAMKRADIQTTRVEKKFVESKIRMVGKVKYDETRVKAITSWVPGRMDRLYVDFTGIQVRAGDHLAWIYSPELLTSQEELIAAARQVHESKESESEFITQSNLRALASAREKLRLAGLTDKQVQEIEERGTAEDHIMINSPMGGIVIDKLVKEGMYVETGTKIYTLADLDHLWVLLDAYESDLPWIRYGQEVAFETVSYPGEVFHGTIAFIDPVLDAKTRTIKVRVNVKNTEGRLKPDMFVKAIVRSRVADGGKVMDPRLAGKWICPMHPEIVKEEEVDCDICQMDLVRAEALGYIAADTEQEKPLVIPVSSVLLTGKRAVVYVKVPGKEQPTFMGREVRIGARAGDFYLIRSGLAEGEEVVTHGNFKIDSALQIHAKPSMMSMPAEGDDQSWVIPDAKDKGSLPEGSHHEGSH